MRWSALARNSHTQPAAAAPSSGLAVLRFLGLLDVLQGVRLRGPRSQALPGRRLRRLAATRREECGLVFVFALLGSLCLAGEPDLDTVMKGYLKALGGEKKAHQITTLKKTGIYVYNGLEHTLNVLHQANRVRMDIDGLQQYGTSVTPGKIVTRAYDGKVAWGINPAGGGKAELDPEEPKPWAGSIVSEADLVSPLVDPHHKDRTLKLIGKEELEGQQVYHLQVTFANRDTQHWYLDTHTFLPVKKSVPEQRRFKPQSWFFSDYRPVNGVMLPHNVEIEEDLFTRVYIFDKIEANVKVDESVFSMPES